MAHLAWKPRVFERPARKVLYLHLESFSFRVDEAAVKLNAAAELVPGLKRVTKGVVRLPMEIHKWTVNRSPHVDKRSREAFERRIYKRLIGVEGDADTVNSFKFYAASCVVPGVGIKAIEHTFLPFDTLYSQPPSAPNSTQQTSESSNTSSSTKDKQTAEQLD